jgi:predicted DNA binding CopG/RHH family protein
MNKRIKYTKGPIDEVRVVADFLPPPAELVVKEDVEKVTISLSKRSVDFFRAEAKRNGTQYQRMIRALLDRYAQLNAPSNKSLERSRDR